MYMICCTGVCIHIYIPHEKALIVNVEHNFKYNILF